MIRVIGRFFGLTAASEDTLEPGNADGEYVKAIEIDDVDGQIFAMLSRLRSPNGNSGVASTAASWTMLPVPAVAAVAKTSLSATPARAAVYAPPAPPGACGKWLRIRQVRYFRRYRWYTNGDSRRPVPAWTPREAKL